MGRKKQTIKELEAEYNQVIKEEVKEEPKVEVKVINVSPFHFEFNNEGLNQLRDKMNELIEFVNK